MKHEHLLTRAIRRHSAGDLPGARGLYRRALLAAPEHGDALFRAGLLELQDGHAETALELIERALRTAPEDRRFLLGRGFVLSQLQRWPDAAEVYRQVLAADPALANAHFALAAALQALGDLPGAIAAYRACISLQPELADAYVNLGNCHIAGGRPQLAEDALREGVAACPDCAPALSNLSTLLQRRGQFEEAAALLRQAVRLAPEEADYRVNLGVALCGQSQWQEAAAVLAEALLRDPDHADARYNLGNALYGLGRLAEAAEQYRLAIRLRPGHADALNNLGNACKQSGEYQQALDAYQAALLAKPGAIAALNNLSCLLLTLGRVDEAELILRHGLELTPHPALYNNLGNVLKAAGELERAIACFRTALRLEPDNAVTHSNLAYSLSFQSEDGRTVREECRRWELCHGAGLGGEARPPQRLRVGYVSAYFRDHCQSFFTIPLLSNHDHAAVEVFCYSCAELEDRYTGRIRGCADVWRDAAALSDAELSAMIRADGIDILVDLTMHMSNGRPLVFARRPAKVQIAWLAYPGTTGLAAMDYWLSDPRLDPAGSESMYSERTLRLPDSFWCYDPLCEELEVNELPALQNGYLTLGCLNNPCKLTEHALALWGAAMRAVPDARRLLMMPQGHYRQDLLRRMLRHGVAPERIAFESYRPRAQYLASYRGIDLGLDTFPYNGHTTSLDAFWMGVPVVTRVGRTCVGRGGLSQLHNLDLLELAADSDQAFAEIVAGLARDLPRLAALRRELRGRMQRSPLMDGARFARNVEALYLQAYREKTGSA